MTAYCYPCLWAFRLFVWFSFDMPCIFSPWHSNQAVCNAILFWNALQWYYTYQTQHIYSSSLIIVTVTKFYLWHHYISTYDITKVLLMTSLKFYLSVQMEWTSRKPKHTILHYTTLHGNKQYYTIQCYMFLVIQDLARHIYIYIFKVCVCECVCVWMCVIFIYSKCFSNNITDGLVGYVTFNTHIRLLAWWGM